MTPTQNNVELRTKIANIVTGRLSPLGKIEALDELIQEQVVAENYKVRADLAWCLGKLRGLEYPAEHLERKYELKQLGLEGK